MEDYYNRSKSYGPGRMNHQPDGGYYGHPQPPVPASYDLRCYSASYAQAQMANYDYGNNTNNNFSYNGKEFKLKKGKSASGSSSSKSWSLGDPEFQRKKRVASYKMYSVEGKVKGTFRKSFRWLKDRYTQMLYGWW
ncbi:DUF3511 domain protein [Melia azedarach]|uniref:DUF3511 domain protein n=1 Tax=Melia azedarach TaxID=155640 RepID=A0ACC1XD12_MELAZ|nr:DUF3511 domain protein [Melia azedarach]